MEITYPDKFLEIRISHLIPPAPTTALCAGFDGGSWRSEQFADHLFEWLPYTALSQENQLTFASHNFIQMLRTASAHIYNSKKTQSRGELGELMLHLACILHFNSVPVMCKLVLKTSPNDTVKGFDGIHIVGNTGDFEIWLGESKLYTDPKRAIRDAVKSVKEHILPSFLTTEKAMVFGHITPNIPNYDAVVDLFKSKTSGDELLKKAVFPILIAYESTAISKFTALKQDFTEVLSVEAKDLKDYFCDKATNIPLRFHLIFIPLGSKSDLVDSFDKKLEAFL